jgi:hypothetical protein
MLDLPATYGLAPRPSWLPESVRLDADLIPYVSEPPRDRYGTRDFEPNSGKPYSGRKLAAEEQDAIRAMWRQTYDIDAICRRFRIAASTLATVTAGV